MKTKMLYKGYRKICDVTTFKTIHAFGDNIKNGAVAVDIVCNE